MNKNGDSNKWLSGFLAFIVNWFVLLFYGESGRHPFFSLLITCI